MKLIGTGTYEKVWEVPGEPKEKYPIFVLRKLTAGEVNDMDDQLTILKHEGGKKTRMSVLIGTARRLKIRSAVVNWRNIEDDNGAPAPCSDINKEKLPAEIQSWLEDIIDEDNKLKGVSEVERKN